MVRVNKNIKVGCCGFPISQKKYFENFNLVEIQKTFYQIPEEDTLIKWRKKAQKEFEFTLKAWQLITHPPSSPTYKRLKIELSDKEKKNYGFFKPTDEVFKAWEKTKKAAEILESKIIIFQCPSSFKQTDENIKNMENFFNSIKNDSFIMGWEVRGNWEEDVIIGICRNLKLIHVVDPFKEKKLYGDIAYWRLHGIGGYRYRYTEEDFSKLIQFIKNENSSLIYILFNNVYMGEDALNFLKILKG